MENSDKIIFKKLKDEFDTFIKDSGNRQILFSGPFGSGKTTFLKDYAEANDDFEFLHIFPVNYSLHSNVDVYEILKYDLILELISRGAFEEGDFSSLTTYLNVVVRNTDNLFGEVISLFSKTGKQLKSLVDLISKAKQTFQKQTHDLKDPLLTLRPFESSIVSIKGYEHEDYITSLIKEKLSSLSNDKQTVLIVDDLDRVDPEHLFRIISVFSAHIDHQTGENKFGFDKIIFVGDLETIKEMYVHKFGTTKSFNGYISKLTSSQPFNFDPADELYQNLFNIFSKYKIREKDDEAVAPLYFGSDPEKYLNKLLAFLFSNLIYFKFISLRDLQKANLGMIRFNTKIYTEKLQEGYHGNELVHLYEILKYFLPKEDVIQCLNKILNSPISLSSVFSGRGKEQHVFADMSSIPLYSLSHRSEFVDKDYGQIFKVTLGENEFQVIAFRVYEVIGLSFKLADNISDAKNLLRILIFGLEDLLQRIK